MQIFDQWQWHQTDEWIFMIENCDFCHKSSKTLIQVLYMKKNVFGTCRNIWSGAFQNISGDMHNRAI